MHNHLKVGPIEQIDCYEGKNESAIEKCDWVEPGGMILVALHISSVIQ